MSVERPPLSGLGGGLIALALAFLMCWPILMTGDAFVFLDTDGYLKTGRKILDMLRPGGSEEVAVNVVVPEGDASSLRSFGYALFLAVAQTVAGPVGAPLLQGWATIWTVFLLVPRVAVERPWVAGALALAMAGTTLPWYVSYLMPDLLAALVIAYGAVLWRAFDGMSGSARVVASALAAAAILSHYGNPPLALVLYGIILGARALQRRLTLSVAVAALLPVFLAPLGNLGASAVVLDDASVAPKRLPVLLARSIEDGPAAWYLAEACPAGVDLAICRAFDGNVPDDTATFLWSDIGIRSLTNAQLQQVREEEYRVLLHAFLAYPVAQTLSLTRNAGMQLVRVGIHEVRPAGGEEARFAKTLKRAFANPVEWTTLLGALALLPLCFVVPQFRAPVAIVCLGLLGNAALFGGLSAPVDRYQGRVAWLIPALTLICCAIALRQRSARAGRELER